MENIFVIMIWHQAGGRDDNTTFYAWADSNGNTITFSTEEKAKETWVKSGMRDIHAGFVVDCTPSNNDWI